MLQKTKTQIIIPTNNLTDSDIQWIERRTSLPLCSVRVAADLRQLADEITQIDQQHNKTILKIRECVGMPRGVSFVS